MEAAKSFGYDAFFNSTREMQAAMVAQLILERVEHSLKTYDANPANFK